MLASLALELAARLDVVAVKTTAARADCFAFRFRPAHLAKEIISLVLSHCKNGLEAQSAGLCR